MPTVADNKIQSDVILKAIELIAGGNKSEFARQMGVSRETVYKYAEEGLQQDQTSFALRLMATSPEARDMILEAAGVEPPSELTPQVRRFAERMERASDHPQWQTVSNMIDQALRFVEEQPSSHGEAQAASA